MQNVITAIRRQKKDADRINVYLNGEFGFSVPLDRAADLKVGQDLVKEQIEKLKREGERDKAYKQAIRYLGYRSRSRAEIVKYLQRKGTGPNVVDHVIRRLFREQYLDDFAFARFWLDNRKKFRPRSAFAIGCELREKGVEEEIIRHILAEFDEDQAAWDAVKSRLNQWRGHDRESLMKKIMGFLDRRGFSYEISRKIFERAWGLLSTSDEFTGFSE